MLWGFSPFREQGITVNDDLRDKKEFRNPGILEMLMEKYQIRETGSVVRIISRFRDTDHDRDLATQSEGFLTAEVTKAERPTPVRERRDASESGENRD